MSNKVKFDKNQIPINARKHGVKCIHCGNAFLVKVCDDEYWCYRCNDYVMIEGV